MLLTKPIVVEAIVFVSHAAASVRSICRRVCVLEHGTLVFDGDVDGGLAHYEHSLAEAAEGVPRPV